MVLPKMDVQILSGRSLTQGRGKEMGKLSDVYIKDVTEVKIDAQDMKELGIEENSNVKVTTQFGSVVLRAVTSRELPHPKRVFISYGPWVNYIVDYRTHGTGMPSIKWVTGTIEPAPTEKVLTIDQVLAELRTK
jgi:formylmethanofuran dehydrogenase subunit D